MTDHPELRSIVNAELQRGEKLLWVGKPLPIRLIMQERKVVVAAILLVIVLIALAMIILIFPNSHLLSLHLLGMGFSFGLIVVGFVLLGLTYFARPIYDYIMAIRTIYAVTDRRALILKGTLRGRVAQSYKQIDQVKRRTLIKGKGDVIFGSETKKVRRQGQSVVVTRKIGFFGIDDARQVEQIMLETFKTQTNISEGAAKQIDHADPTGH